MTHDKKSLEKVIIAGLMTANEDPRLFEEDMQELKLLCGTAGAKILATFTQRRDSPVASTFIGSGKLEEIKAALVAGGAQTLVIDAQLSPGQVRNIEKIIEAKVIDRSQLILDIFAMHARTNEARIQVELAQMRTLYPRLTHAWTHFSQQVGGIGTRGPGEKQLEVDRRLVQNKISDLKRRLDKIEKHRIVQRQGREGVFKAALVGYTNVGKSSLLNALCGADVLVKNKLFATLDTSTRRAYIHGAGSIVISDTVGFLRKLPHHLVASFRSTLSVVNEADLLIVVMDASSEFTDQQLATVNNVLLELDAVTVPKLMVFNKIDLMDDPFTRKRLSIAHPDALFVSAFNKEDIARLKGAIGQAVLAVEKERRIEQMVQKRTRDLASRHPDAFR
jgi:GTPase